MINICQIRNYYDRPWLPYPPSDIRDYLEKLNCKAGQAMKEGKWMQAEQLIGIVRAEACSRGIHTAWTIHNSELRGMLLYAQGKHCEAIAVLRDAAETSQRCHEEEHEMNDAIMLYVRALIAAKDFETAEEQLRLLLGLIDKHSKPGFHALVNPTRFWVIFQLIKCKKRHPHALQELAELLEERIVSTEDFEDKAMQQRAQWTDRWGLRVPKDQTPEGVNSLHEPRHSYSRVCDELVEAGVDFRQIPSLFKTASLRYGHLEGKWFTCVSCKQVRCVTSHNLTLLTQVGPITSHMLYLSAQTSQGCLLQVFY